MAGLAELSARRSQLREELRQLTGKDPLDPLNPVLASPESACNKNNYFELTNYLSIGHWDGRVVYLLVGPDEFSEAGLELQLSESFLLVKNQLPQFWEALSFAY